MFKKSANARNVGIMQELDDTLAADDSDYDSGKMISRTPRSPEILMNNLRGDMRSVDERMNELIDLVGEEAAYQTPPEVLTLLQPIFKEQQAAGIAGLPPGAAGAPPGAPPGMPPMPPGMPPGAAGAPPGAPPGMPPMPPPGPEAAGIGGLPTAQGPAMEPPVQMAAGGYVQRFRNGGYVQNFKDGSDERGATPPSANRAEALDPVTERMLLRSMAVSKILNSELTRGSIPEPKLEDEFERRKSVYQSLIGEDAGAAEKEKYMALTEAFLNLASNTDPTTGKPMRGGFLSKLGGSFKGTPSKIAAIDQARRKQDLGIKMAALESAERYIDTIRKQNADLIGKDTGEWLKTYTATQEDDFQVPSSRNQAIEWLARVAPAYAAGTAPDDVSRTFEAVYLDLSKDSYYISQDPVTGQPRKIITPGVKYSWAEDAIKARGRLADVAEETGAPVSISRPNISLDEEGNVTSPEGEASISPSSPEMEGGPAPESAGQPPAAEETSYSLLADQPDSKEPWDPSIVPKVWEWDPLDKRTVAGGYYFPHKLTMFNAASGTGPIGRMMAALYKTPGVGEISSDLLEEAARNREILDNSAREIVRAFQSSRRFAEGERQAIVKQLDLESALFDRPGAYMSRLIAYDQLLQELQRNEIRDFNNDELPPDVRKDIRASLKTIHDARALIGAPIAIEGKGDPLLDTLPMGTMVYDNTSGKIWQIKE